METQQRSIVYISLGGSYVTKTKCQLKAFMLNIRRVRVHRLGLLLKLDLLCKLKKHVDGLVFTPFLAQNIKKV
jgi:hypothetical protein